MTKRRYVPTKKLGSKRIDLPLPKKKEYIRRIVTLKQPYKVVRKIYAAEFGKDLHQAYKFSKRISLKRQSEAKRSESLRFVSQLFFSVRFVSL
jgi:hypothetical protein